MFITYNIAPRTQYHDHSHTIREYRAPTDEIVKLLREMETAAQSNVVDVIKNKDNEFHYSAHIFNHLSDPFNYEVKVRYTINGKQHSFSFEQPVPPFSQTNDMKLSLAKEIRDRIATELATQITISIFSSKDL